MPNEKPLIFEDPRSIPLNKRQWIIDGGYLSFTYGIHEQLTGWHRVRLTAPWNRSLIFLDRSSERKIFYPDYKSRRREAHKIDERKQMMRRRVTRFRDFLEVDTMVPTVSVEGLEADDLLAWWYLIHEPKFILAIDKDLLQLPEIPMFNMKLQPVKVSGGRDSKLPQYMFNLLPSIKTHPWLFYQRWLLFHVLRGDHSDSIPRLLPSRGSEPKLITQHLCLSSEPFTEAYELLGADFLRNLKLIALPWYRLRSDHELIDRAPKYFTHLFDHWSYWAKKDWVNPGLEAQVRDSYDQWLKTKPDGGLDWEEW